ncbi:MAG: hypothetical protein IBX39_04725 [Candidatus Methanoperedenaceae archaeon]|nr:hypothetical protein [Candidatus Methanoperedenaceae archaeon]MDW7726254.1 hypothetical protein [Candidatus Methanoperedens sp.]
MTKMHLEIGSSVVSVLLFILLLIAVKILMPETSGYGYTAALLIFMVIMGLAGLKLAEIPDK